MSAIRRKTNSDLIRGWYFHVIITNKQRMKTMKQINNNTNHVAPPTETSTTEVVTKEKMPNRMQQIRPKSSKRVLGTPYMLI